MALRASRRTQDQNLSVHIDGIKTNGSTVQKKGGGLGGRKALDDISNSGKPSALQASRKHNLMNGIPIGEDLGPSKKSQFPVGEKTKKPPEKAQAGGRKALGDLTNSVNPFAQQQGLKKKVQDKKLMAAAGEGTLPHTIAEERFLHNHQECINSQRKALDMDQFLKTIGLDEDVFVQSVSAIRPVPRKSKHESPMKLFEMEELPELLIEDQSRQAELLLSGQSSPFCGSPKSPRLPYMNLKDYNDFPGFVLTNTPRMARRQI